MKRFSQLLWGLFASAVLLCNLHHAVAQGIENAQLNGTVTDASGGVVVGASIVARNTATDATFTATSNGSGFYAIANMRPGTYELKVFFIRICQLHAERNRAHGGPGCDGQCGTTSRCQGRNRGGNK